MDKTLLVGPDIEEGRKFLDLLKNEGFPIVAALWQSNHPDEDRWDLHIVTPLVEELGLKETYRRLLSVVARTSIRPGVDLLNVSVFTPQSSYYKNLRRDLRRMKDRHVSRQPIGNRFIIGNGFVYFVK